MLMMLWSPRREWAGLERTEGNANCQSSCTQAREAVPRQGTGPKQAQDSCKAASPVSQKGFWALRCAVGWGKELWEVEEGIGSEAEEV